jgi:lipopolysaccharide export LptBFGC system permease protein LptF
MFRIPRTLWRAIIFDLLRLILLTAAVLVAILAFAAAIQPLSNGKLSAADTLRFIGLAIVPMLAYALPFAAGFGATLVYYRIAQDNEAVAVYAGGISHRRLLAPALIVAILASASLAVLNEQVIPRFLRGMARLITVDMARFTANEIGKGRSVAVGEMIIWADQARRLEPDPGSGATEELLLSKFAAVELDNEGNPTVEATSTSARLWLIPGGGPRPTSSAPSEQDEANISSRVVMRLQNVVAIQEGRATGGFRDRVDLAWDVPSAFRDNPKFLTSGELASLRDNPAQINWIETRRRNLALTLAERTAVEDMQRQIREHGSITLTDDRNRPVTIFAAQMTWEVDRWKFSPAPGTRVRVELLRPVSGPGGTESDVATTITASFVTMANDLADASVARRLEFALEALDATTRGADDAAATQRERITLSPLAPDPKRSEALLAMSVTDLVNASKTYVDRPVPDPLVQTSLDQLTRQLSRLSRDVLGKQHERWAMAASCFVMVLTGAVTALGMSKRQPLTVYLWTFAPALICIVTISGGQQMVRQSGVAGLFLMWSGVAAMATYTLIVYRKLAVH